MSDLVLEGQSLWAQKYVGKSVPVMLGNGIWSSGDSVVPFEAFTNGHAPRPPKKVGRDSSPPKARPRARPRVRKPGKRYELLEERGRPVVKILATGEVVKQGDRGWGGITGYLARAIAEQDPKLFMRDVSEEIQRGRLERHWRSVEGGGTLDPKLFRGLMGRDQYEVSVARPEMVRKHLHGAYVGPSLEASSRRRAARDTERGTYAFSRESLVKPYDSATDPDYRPPAPREETDLHRQYMFHGKPRVTDLHDVYKHGRKGPGAVLSPEPELLPGRDSGGFDSRTHLRDLYKERMKKRGCY